MLIRTKKPINYQRNTDNKNLIRGSHSTHASMLTHNIITWVFESKDPCAVENFLKRHDFTTSKGIVYVGYKQALWRHISPKAAYNNVTLCYGVPARFSSDNNYYWVQTPPNVVFLHTVHNVSDSSLLLSYHILYTVLHKCMITLFVILYEPIIRVETNN